MEKWKEALQKLMENRKFFWGGLTLITISVLLFVYKDEVNNFLQSFISNKNSHSTISHSPKVEHHSVKSSQSGQKREQKKEQKEEVENYAGIGKVPAIGGRVQVATAVEERRSFAEKKEKIEFPSESVNVESVNINTDEIVKKVIERLLSDKKLQEEFFKVILGLKDISEYAIDVSKFEVRKKVLERDIELLKLLIQKQKLNREYTKLLNPPEEKENKLIKALTKDVIQLKNQIALLQKKIKELESKQVSSRLNKNENKKEGILIKPKITPQDLLKKYLGFFIAVIKIGGKTYVVDRRQVYYPVGSILEDGTQIVEATLTTVKIRKDNVEVVVPLDAEEKMDENSKSNKKLPF